MINTEYRIQNTEYRIDVSDLIGKPYKTGGRGPANYDCWGICMAAASRAGIDLPDIDVPDGDELKGKAIAEQKQNNFRKIGAARPYSIALFRIIDDDSQIKWHVGLVLENCRNFLHTTGKMGANISSLTDPVWRLFLEGFYEPA